MRCETAFHLAMRAAGRLSDLQRHRKFYNQVLKEKDFALLEEEEKVLQLQMERYTKIVKAYSLKDPVQTGWWLKGIEAALRW